MGSDKLILVNGVELCFDTFGDSCDPAILLIGGSGASMDWWEDELCERLADGGRFVIRYDHRDTGQSVSYPPGAPGYTGADLVHDAAGLLEAFCLTGAHVVGISMGGAIAQLLALDHPRRIATITLIATSPGPGDPDLPGMSFETLAEFDVKPPDWSKRDEVVDHLTHLARVSAARSRPFEEAEFRRLAERVVDRTINLKSSFTNHDLLEGDGPWRRRLGDLAVPALVVHGAEDPVFPHAHGVALAREIAGAELLTLERTGHELPRSAWDTLVPAILEHTSGQARGASSYAAGSMRSVRRR